MKKYVLLKTMDIRVSHCHNKKKQIKLHSLQLFLFKEIRKT